jgi:hypothetical protein
MPKIDLALNLRNLLVAAASATLLSTAATAQQSFSRQSVLDATAVAATPLRLRAEFEPQMQISRAPTAEQRIGPLTTSEETATASAKSTVTKLLSTAPSGRPLPQYVGPVIAIDEAPVGLRWRAVEGGFVAQFEVVSVGAVGLRAQLVLPVSLAPTLTQIRVASATTKRVEVFSASWGADGRLYTPYTDGSAQQIEIFVKRPIADASVRVVDLTHYTESLFGGLPAPLNGFQKAGACTVNTLCTSNDAALDAAIAERKKSVARINFNSGGGSFLCTGTLVNSQQFPVPLFLTANHCISTAAEAASVATIWFREALTCETGNATDNASFIAGQVNLSGGAQLLFTNQMADSTLLRLNATPPAGVMYSGWNAASLLRNDNVVSISHPGGSPSKFALGTVNVINAAGANVGAALLRLFGYPQDMYGVAFTRGIIEGGSSGSGIFTLNNGSLQLRGILSSSTLRNDASLSCSNTNENANYGRFEIFYPQIAPFLLNQAFPTDDFPNQPTPTGPLLPLNGQLDATLSYPGDIDSFRVVISEPGKLTIGTRGEYDTVGVLLRADGGCVLAPGKTTCNNAATNDDASSTDLNFGVKDIAVQSGTYYVNIASWDPNLTTPNGYKMFANFVPDTAQSTLAITRAGSSSGSVSSSPAGITCGSTCSGGFNTNTVVTLTATPVANAFFVGWNGCSQISINTCQVTMDAAKSVTATFNTLPPVLALSRRGGVDLDGAGSGALLVRSLSNNTLFAGRLVGSAFQWTAVTDPGVDFRLLGAVDFLGNGRSDLAMLRDNPSLLNSNGQGSAQFWTDFNAASTVFLRDVRPAWDVQAAGDLDGDGFGDLVWRFRGSSATIDDQGVSYIWFTNGTSFSQLRKRGGAPLTWTLLGSADLNFDGAADMVYVSPENAMRVLMATPGRTCANLSGGSLPNGFTALRLADFTGNRRGDVLARNAATGEVRLISLNATGYTLPPYAGAPDDANASCTPTSLVAAQTSVTVGTADPTWTYLASGDFNGDGRFDIVWRRPDNTLVLWLMGANGVIQTTLTNAGTLPTNSAPVSLQ